MEDGVAAQKAVFELVVDFLLDGLPNHFGETMVDVLATTATARMSRRSVLQRVGRSEVVADTLNMLIRMEDAAKELLDWERRAMRLWDTLQQAVKEDHMISRVRVESLRNAGLQWFGQTLIARDYNRSTNNFGCKIIQPTLAKWRGL
jgi:hypothetical protein